MPTNKRKRPAAATTVAPPELTIDPDDPLVAVREIAQESMRRFPSPPSIWRWCGRGATGIRLPSVMLSGRWMTTRRCWLAWLQARTAAKLDPDTVQTVQDASDTGPGEVVLK